MNENDLIEYIKENNLSFFIEKIFEEKINDNFNLIKIRPIKYIDNNFENKYSFKKNRTINFDNINYDGLITIVDEFDSWINHNIFELNIKNNNGIYCLLNFLERDTKINNFSSFEKNYLNIVFNFENSSLIYKKVSEILEVISKIINEVNLEASRKFNFKKVNLPKKILIFDYNKLIDDLIVDRDFKGIKNNLSMKYGIVALKDNDLINIIWYSEKNKKSNSISKIKVFKTKKTNLINITIDLDLIKMIILNKNKINELQNNN